MILIADSGATKTEWRLIDHSTTKQTIHTEGLNPYYHTEASTIEVLKNNLLPELTTNDIEHIYFYGAGCDNPEKVDRVQQAIESCFTETDVNVYHDLLAAARACCMHEPGIACILGTGSNSCLYDGKHIEEHIPSLAFILGDEGSAGYFGKMLINRYFRKEIPDDLIAPLEENYNMDLDFIMDKLYNGAQFSRFIASYGKFLGDHEHHPYIEKMLHEGFNTFITRIIKKYTNAASYEVSFVGSVARAHQEQITTILDKQGLKTGSFVQNPMDNLVRYHQV